MIGDTAPAEQTEDDPKNIGEDEGKENKSGKDNEVVATSPKVVVGPSGTDREVPPEAVVDLENQLKKARAKLRQIRKVFYQAQEDAQAQPEMRFAVRIAGLNVEEALEEVQDLEKRLGTCIARKEARRSVGSVQRRDLTVPHFDV
jgi:hypothetical protein